MGIFGRELGRMGRNRRVEIGRIRVLGWRVLPAGVHVRRRRCECSLARPIRVPVRSQRAGPGEAGRAVGGAGGSPQEEAVTSDETGPLTGTTAETVRYAET